MAAGGSALALAVAGCGGGNDHAKGTPAGGGNTQSGQSPQASTPKTGGTITLASLTDPATFDPYTNIAYNAQEFAGTIYSRVLKPKTGPNIGPNQLVITTDVAAAMPEIIGDGTQLSIKIRPDVKYHNLSPLGGRLLTAEDVKFSLDRYRAIGQQNSTFEPVSSVETPDATTVVLKLKRPTAAILTYLAWGTYAWIMPKETIGADNKHPEGSPHVGTGPYMFDNYTPGTGASFKKHPEYFLSGQPYIDNLRRLVIPDSSTVLANFRSGQIDVTSISENDIGSVRQANPKANYVQYPEVAVETFYFGEGIARPPFNDVRARQAVSMAVDRDAILATSYAGKGEWQTLFPAKYDPWWLDPRGKDFGPNAKYFKKNVAEAKQLLAAAGYPNGLNVDLNVTFDYGAPAKERYELLAAMLKEAGVNATLKSKEYAAYQSTTSLGKFEGLAYGPYAVYPDPDGFLSTYWISSSARRKSKWEDLELDQLISKQATLFDTEQRKQVVWDIQRHVAEKAYAPPGVNGLIYVASQPWIKNYYASIDYGSSSNSVVYAWIERS